MNKFSVKSEHQILSNLIKRGAGEYDYSNVVWVNVATKIEILCLSCNKTFWQTYNSHLSGCGCPQCGKIKQGKSSRLGSQKILERIKATHGDKYDYSKCVITIMDKKIQIICPNHGSFWQAPEKHIYGQGCPKCRASHGERSIFMLLQQNNINIVTQHSFNKHPELRGTGYSYLTFDFYLPDYNLCIEYDGEHHFNFGHYHKNSSVEDLCKIQQRDNTKNWFCMNNKIGLLRVPYWVNITKEKLLSSIEENTNVRSLI